MRLMDMDRRGLSGRSVVFCMKREAGNRVVYCRSVYVFCGEEKIVSVEWKEERRV